MDAITSMANAAHNAGLPMIVESVLWGNRVIEQKDPERLAFGARVAFELGADIVKTEYSGDASSMRDIVNSCPVPVMVLGGSRTNDFDGLLENTRDAIGVGAKGVIYGRNVWQNDDPIGVSRQLREIIHGS
jgi:DhnA family fructose-bisphosphate aldolase class Ia